MALGGTGVAMRYLQGRLIDHVHIRVADLAASKRFYLAVLGALGMQDAFGEGDGYFYADELFVDVAETEPSHVHIAFQAKDEATVKRFYDAALEAGGTDNGRPGLRQYHSKYFGAFVRDPDGNNIEAVWHGETARSSDSIVIERKA